VLVNQVSTSAASVSSAQGKPSITDFDPCGDHQIWLEVSDVPGVAPCYIAPRKEGRVPRAACSKASRLRGPSFVRGGGFPHLMPPVSTRAGGC
jgi:hypothetical protein